MPKQPPLTWQTSTFCAETGCVAVALWGDAVLVRDSKHAHGPVLTFTLDEWQAFLLGVAAGEFVPQVTADRSTSTCGM